MVIVNRAAEERHDAALAIDDRVRCNGACIERSRIRHQLEGRSGLIDITDRVVTQQAIRRMAEIIWIESWADRECQNLARMRVLHNNRAVQRLVLFHGVVERFFGNVLNFFVDRQLQVLAGQRLLQSAGERMTLGVEVAEHMAGSSVQIIVVLTFQSAQAGVIRAYIA